MKQTACITRFSSSQLRTFFELGMELLETWPYTSAACKISIVLSVPTARRWLIRHTLPGINFVSTVIITQIRSEATRSTSFRILRCCYWKHLCSPAIKVWFIIALCPRLRMAFQGKCSYWVLDLLIENLEQVRAFKEKAYRSLMINVFFVCLRCHECRLLLNRRILWPSLKWYDRCIGFFDRNRSLIYLPNMWIHSTNLILE